MYALIAERSSGEVRWGNLDFQDRAVVALNLIYHPARVCSGTYQMAEMGIQEVLVMRFDLFFALFLPALLAFF